jgi:hypothetical protein
MAHHFALTAHETTGQMVELLPVLESEVCGSGFAMQIEAIVGGLLSIDTPREEVAQYLLGFGLSWDQVNSGFAAHGLAN